MINFDDYTNENKTLQELSSHNQKWSYIPDHPYRILIISTSGSGKANALLNLINNQPDIDKIYLYAKDPYEAKYQFLVNKRESTGLESTESTVLIVKLLLSIQMICKMFTEILMNTIQIKNAKY